MKAKQSPANNPQQLIHHAVLLHQSGHLAEAATEYKKLLRTYPNHPQLLTGLGTIALQQGEFDQAVTWLKNR